MRYSATPTLDEYLDEFQHEIQIGQLSFKRVPHEVFHQLYNTCISLITNYFRFRTFRRENSINIQINNLN